MKNIANVISWKFKDQPGMATTDGVITDFPGGIPSAEDQEAWTTEYEAAMVSAAKNETLSAVRSARDTCLNRLIGIAFAAQTTGDAATVAACLAARGALLNITTAPGVATATDDASLKAALVAAYAAIVLAAPANVRSAFAEFNL